MKNNSRTIGLIVLAMSLLILAGCSPITASSAGSTPTMISPIPTPITPPPSPSPVPSPTASPAQMRTSSIHMITPQAGWALAWNQDRSVGGVFRTGDGGANWQNVSPPSVLPASIQTGYFADANSAWLVAGAPTTAPDGTALTTLTVYRTVDGGQSWKSSPSFDVPGGGGAGVLDFVDAQNGWLMAGLGAAAGSEAVEIFTSVDGGMSWEGVSLASGYPDQSTPGSLPFSCDKTGITFFDAYMGWATGACPGGPIFLYVTYDRGQTWQTPTMPAPPGYAANIFSQCQCFVDQPLFVAPKVGFITIKIYEATQSAFLYATTNNGFTWTPRKLPTSQPVGPLDFIDANNGWVTDGTQVYASHDGGQSWTLAGPLPVPGSIIYGGLDFVDVNNGWLMSDQGPYVTHDGGQTWASITPVFNPTTSATLQQRINFPAGNATYSFIANLAAGASQDYVVRVLAGQQMVVSASGNATVAVLDPQGNAMPLTTLQPQQWQVSISQTGDYTLLLSGQGQTTVTLYIPPLPAPQPTPLPPAGQRITFPPGSSSYTFTTTLTLGASQRYVLRALTGQRVVVTLSGNAAVSILDPQGNVMPLATMQPQQWQASISQTGDYTLVLSGQGQTTVMIDIPPANSSIPTVTLDNNGQTITLSAGQRFLLDLGEGYTWTVAVGDQTIVSRVMNIAVIRGAQGVYRANKSGATMLTATGDPVCRQAQPPCAAPSRVFQIQVVVQ